MKKLKYIFSRSYRKHRWASKHLVEYRALCPRWLFIRKIWRVNRRPLIFKIVIEKDTTGVERTVIIPKFREITALELADDIPMN